VYHEEDDNRKCAKCKAETMSDEALKALEHFFTVEEYVCLPGDRTAWYAINKASGIMCPGRDTFDLALQDAEAINAAVKRATEDLRARVAELEKIEAEAKAAGMIGPNGRVRKVLGRLPLTADGCIFGIDAPLVYAIYNGKVVGAACSAESNPCDVCGNDNLYIASEVYSTREAAEAARAAKEGGASC